MDEPKLRLHHVATQHATLTEATTDEGQLVGFMLHVPGGNPIRVFTAKGSLHGVHPESDEGKAIDDLRQLARRAVPPAPRHREE